MFYRPVIVTLVLGLMHFIAPLESRGETTESYALQYQVRGQTLIQTVHLFSESPADNPKLVQQIKDMNLDHVLFLEEAADPGVKREISGLNDYDRVKQDIQARSQTPTEVVKTQPGFFIVFAQNWKRAFGIDKGNPEQVIGRKKGVVYGLVGLTSKVGTYSAMLVSTHRYGFAVGIRMLMAQALFAYLNNAYPEEITRFENSNFTVPNATTTTRSLLSRKLLYFIFQSEIYKWTEFGSDLWTGVIQSGIVVNALTFGLGEAVLASQVYKAYQNDPMAKEKIDKICFWSSAGSGLLVSLDLMKHPWMPSVLQVGVVDFRLSGGLFIGYIVAISQWAKTNPDGLFQAFVKLEGPLGRSMRVLGLPFQRAGKWITGAISNCDSIFH